MLTHNYGYVEKGDFVVNLNAMPAYEGGKTNTLRLSTI
jgi:pyruvate kinase